jgi:hypothetical protein
MPQNINKGNLYQAAKQSNLNPAQMNQINSLADMYSTHTTLSNLPTQVASYEFNQLNTDKQKKMAEFFGQNDETPNRGLIGQAAYIISRPVVEPIKAIFNAANWASDQVTRAYRTGAIAAMEKEDLADAWKKSGANGEMVFNDNRIKKAIEIYGANRIAVAQKISAGIPLDQIVAEAQNEEQKSIAFAVGSKEGDKLTEEAIAKVNAAKYSPGRQLANLFLGEDMEGKSGLYTWISGTADAAFRIRTDPTIFLGKARKMYIANKYALTKTVGTAEKVENAFANPNIANFWTEYTKSLDELTKARANGESIKIGETVGRLDRLAPGFRENGVDSALIKFANEDFGGIIDTNTAKAFLSNAQRIEPIFYGQAGFQIKVMPRLSEFRRKRVDLYTKGERIFNLNDDGTDFVRNIVFDDADGRGITEAQAALESLIGREGETAIEAGRRTAERIKASLSDERLKRFSVFGINQRLDKVARKFSLMPDMAELGNFTSDKSVIAFQRYATLAYGRFSARTLADAYATANIGQRREMFIGLQSAVGELRGLRGTAGGRKLLDSIGSIGREAQYTNRVFDADNLDGKIPSQVDGFDSAAYAFQINDRMAFITPKQLDQFAARDGWIGSIWGFQYGKAADDAVSTFVTGTLAGPRFPLRNALEDYIFYLANGNGVIKSGMKVAKARRLATDIRTASDELTLGMINRYGKAADKEKILLKFDDIRNNIKREMVDGNEVITQNAYKTTAERELAKRKIMAEVLLRDKFNDAQIGSFGDDFDQFAYEFAMHGDFENLLRSASEGAYNMNAGNDFFSRAKRVSRKHGRVVDFTIDGEEYARQYGSFVTLSPLDQEGKLAWAFQIVAKGNDEIGSEGLKLLKTYGDNRTKFINAMSRYIDSEEIAKIKPKFDRYVDETYTSTQHAAVIYDDLKAMLSMSDGKINKDLLDKIVVTNADGGLSINLKDFSTSWLPTDAKMLPKSITGPRFIPATQSQNIISDLNSRLWDWLGDANARFSRDQLVIDAAFSIRKDLQPYLDDLTQKIGKEAATRQVVEMSEKLAVERVLAFVDNPDVRTQMAWSMRNFARFYRATEDAYRRLYRTTKYSPEGLRKIAMTYEGVTHTGFVQRDDQGEAYFVYPGIAPVYEAVNKTLNLFGLGDKFVSPMPLQFGSSIKMLTPSANAESWLPTFSGPISGITLKTIYSIAGLFQESDLPLVGRLAKEVKLTEKFTLGSIGEGQSIFQAALPGHVNRLISALSPDERDSQYASAFRKAVTYLEAGGHTPSATATPGELANYQKQLRATISGILLTRFALGFVSPASPTTTLKSDMAEWVRENGRVNFKQVFSKLIEQYQGDPDPVGRAMADWTKYYPEQVPYVLNESDPVFQASFKTSNAAANWVQENSKLIKQYPEGAAFLIPQSGTFSWESYQFLKDNGYRENKLVGDYLRETFVAKAKYFFYEQRDKYEAALVNAGTDSERKRINDIWDTWSKEYKGARPLLQEEFAQSASNNIKRQAAYDDLKRMLNETGIQNEATRKIRSMIDIYEDYLLNKDTVYNSRSERDIKARDILRESTLTQLKSIAATNENAASVFATLFSNFLREG